MSNDRRAESSNDRPMTTTSDADVYHADRYVETVNRDGQFLVPHQAGGARLRATRRPVGMAVALLNAPEDCSRPFFNKSK